MNYVKTYEGFFTSYNVGDYVVLKTEIIGIRISIPDDSKLQVKIIEIDKLDKFTQKFSIIRKITELIPPRGKLKPYKGEFYNDVTIRFANTDVLRKMTKDEIEEYELKRTSKKYNL